MPKLPESEEPEYAARLDVLLSEVKDICIRNKVSYVVGMSDGKKFTVDHSGFLLQRLGLCAILQTRIAIEDTLDQL